MNNINHINHNHNPASIIMMEDSTKTTTRSSSSSNRSSSRKHRRPKNSHHTLRALPQLTQLITSPIFLGLSGLLAVALAISFWLVLVHPDGDIVRLKQQQHDLHHVNDHHVSADNVVVDAVVTRGATTTTAHQDHHHPSGDAADAIHDMQHHHQEAEAELEDGPHLTPRLPHLPIFAKIENGEQLAQDTLSGKHPTLAGIAHILNHFTQALHESNVQLSERKSEVPEIVHAYFTLAKQHLGALEAAYRGRSIFPIRNDDSIYMSLAAFREHLLSQTLQSAFDQAAHPERLFIGAIVQNCFGTDGQVCRTGLQVVGKDKNGRDTVEQFDAPPDENGIETFCNLEKYKKYCDRGQIRALYIHDTDALGPATARYYASKLWGGETYFLQMDSHLEFAPQWDTKYIDEVQAAKSYPKAVLSAYPPGFTDFGQYQGGTPGARLCSCAFSTNSVESNIIRINVGGRTPPEAPRPTQIAFIAAGFFFAHADFLTDVPFDPYVPWCFMGEEIALSMRAWTQGWDIYAPRQNLIAHQYRPGRLGLPKFWEAVGKNSHRPNLNTRLQSHVIRRIKHMVGYPTDTEEIIHQEGDLIVLTEKEFYGMGTVRTKEAYLELTGIDVVQQQCHTIQWCNRGELE